MLKKKKTKKYANLCAIFFREWKMSLILFIIHSVLAWYVIIWFNIFSWQMPKINYYSDIFTLWHFFCVTALLIFTNFKSSGFLYICKTTYCYWVGNGVLHVCYGKKYHLFESCSGSPISWSLVLPSDNVAHMGRKYLIKKKKISSWSRCYVFLTAGQSKDIWRKWNCRGRGGLAPNPVWLSSCINWSNRIY